MRYLSQYEKYFVLFSQAGKEIDENIKKEKEIKIRRGSMKEGRVLKNQWIYSVYIA